MRESKKSPLLDTNVSNRGKVAAKKEAEITTNFGLCLPPVESLSSMFAVLRETK